MLEAFIRNEHTSALSTNLKTFFILSWLFGWDDNINYENCGKSADSSKAEFGSVSIANKKVIFQDNTKNEGDNGHSNSSSAFDNTRSKVNSAVLFERLPTTHNADYKHDLTSPRMTATKKSITDSISEEDSETSDSASVTTTGARSVSIKINSKASRSRWWLKAIISNFLYVLVIAFSAMLGSSSNFTKSPKVRFQWFVPGFFSLILIYILGFAFIVEADQYWMKMELMTVNLMDGLIILLMSATFTFTSNIQMISVGLSCCVIKIILQAFVVSFVSELNFLRRKSEDLKSITIITVPDFEKLWNNPIARKAIYKVTQSHFAIENY